MSCAIKANYHATIVSTVTHETWNHLVSEEVPVKKMHICPDAHALLITDFISHSASVLQLQFLYQVALANKVKDKVIVDIGSRLGAVLYSVSFRCYGNVNWTGYLVSVCYKGYLFTQAKKLIGIELNEWFCQLQRDIVKRYKMNDRIEVRTFLGDVYAYQAVHIWLAVIDYLQRYPASTWTA